MAINSEIIEITTKSSIKVKPRLHDDLLNDEILFGINIFTSSESYFKNKPVNEVLS